MPSLEQAIAQGRNHLALLAGRNPGRLDAMLSGSRGNPDPAGSLAVGIPADALRQRPDVRLAGYQLLAAAANTRAAEATAYPSLNLSGIARPEHHQLAKPVRSGNPGAQRLASLASPIFDAGRISANIEAATAPRNRPCEPTAAPCSPRSRKPKTRSSPAAAPPSASPPWKKPPSSPARPTNSPASATRRAKSTSSTCSIPSARCSVSRQPAHHPHRPHDRLHPALSSARRRLVRRS